MAEKVTAAERARRKRAAELLGETTPDAGEDEWGDAADRTRRDEEFLRDVPPHHN